MAYCLEIYINKVKEGKLNVVLNCEDLENLTKSIIEIVKQILKVETDENRYKLFFLGLFHLFEKIVVLVNSGKFESEKLSKNVKSIISIFEKIIEKFNLKNIENKLKEISNKLL
jgi:hypothetical protein